MTITPVTPAKFAALKAELAKQATVTDTTITGHGVTANYTYEPASQVLNIDVIHKPFYITQCAIEGQLRDELSRLAG